MKYFKKVFRLYYWFNNEVAVDDFENEQLAHDFINAFDVEVFSSMWTITNTNGDI